MKLPDQPWENTFNFAMVSLVFGSLLIVMWVAMIAKGGYWWLWLVLVTLTVQAFNFVMPPIRKWLRNAG